MLGILRWFEIPQFFREVSGDTICFEYLTIFQDFSTSSFDKKKLEFRYRF